MNKSINSHGAQRRILRSSVAALLLAGSALVAGQPTAQAQDAGALVDVLVRKGVLTNQEADDVRADLSRDLSQTSAGKIKLSNSVTELKLYGDLRLRYQYEQRDAQLPDSGNNFQQSRYRFRLRINAEAKLGRDWFAGFSLGTGPQADSEEQTFENGFDDYNIFITRAYLGWQPNDWLTVVAGKQKNPFYTTDLIWDPDITPTGVTETIAFHKMPIFGGSGGPTGGYAKDGKAVAPPEPSKPAESPWELTLVAGQFIFDDNGEFNLDSDLSTDAYLFVEQLIGTYKFNKSTSITIAPGFYTYTAADLSGLTNAAGFTDAGDLTAQIPVNQTTVTGRDRVVYAYNAAGDLTGATVTRRETTAVQVSQPTATANGISTVTRVVDTRERVTSTTALTADQAIARAQQAGVATSITAGTAGRTTQTDDDNVTVRTTSSTTTSLAAVSGETRQLHILTAPGDISFKLGGIKSKLYWDFAYNTGGRERFEDIYQLFNPGTNQFRYSERDGVAWLAGLQFGELKKKGDWQVNANYREVGIASIDPNLNDSTWALSRLNQRGFKLGLAYQIADPVVLSVTGYLAWNLNEDLVGGRATNAPAVADSNAVQVLQVDLAVKF
jgi:hypothetical protein